jgi:hypothetical protein
MLLEDVARHLRVDAAIIGRVVREPMRYGDAKGCGDEKQNGERENPFSISHFPFLIFHFAECRDSPAPNVQMKNGK